MSEQFSNHCQFSVADNRIVYESIACNFSAYLKARGHSASTQNAYLSALRHFICWLTDEFPPKEIIDSRSVCVFLYEHLPVCHCPPPVFKELKTVRAALNQLLLLLGHERLLSNASKGSAAIEYSLRQFDDYLDNVCGFTKSTRLYRQRQVRTFLVELFGTGSINTLNITPEILIKFVTK